MGRIPPDPSGIGISIGEREEREGSGMSSGDRQTVLVVAAHPDDEVLGAGGVMAKHAQKGDEVFSLIIGDGITSRYEESELNKDSTRKQVEAIREGPWC
jgi:LmbE family N-acetylglucosaminyl deacetylase